MSAASGTISLDQWDDGPVLNDFHQAGGRFNSNALISNMFASKLTGATGFPSIARPVTETWAFADSLQASAPISFDITYHGSDYGIGSAGPDFARNGPDIQDGPNGARVTIIVNVGSNSFTSFDIAGGFLYDPTKDGAVYQASYVSADTNRASFIMCDGPNAFADMFFGIERTKDSNGNDTNEGAIVHATLGHQRAVYGPYYQNRVWSQVILFSGIAASRSFNFDSAVTTHPSAKSVSSGYVGASEVCTFNFRPYNSGMNLMLHYGDLQSGETLVVHRYGADHTYIAMKGNTANKLNLTSRPSTATVLMRYE